MGKTALQHSRTNAFVVPPEAIIIPGFSPGYENHWAGQGKSRLIIDEPFLRDIMFEGVHTPIDVIKEGEAIIVIKGRRRVFHGVEANRRLTEMGKLPLKIICLVKSGEQREVLGISASENIHRLDLSPIMKAREADKLRKFSATEDEIAIYLGATEQTLTNWSKILELNPEVLKIVERGEIDAYAALELHGLSFEEQLDKVHELLAGPKKPTRNDVKKAKDPNAVQPTPKKKLLKLLYHAEDQLEPEFVKGLKLGLGLISPLVAGVQDLLEDALAAAKAPQQEQSMNEDGVVIAKKRSRG